MAANGHRFSFWGDKNVVNLDSGGGWLHYSVNTLEILDCKLQRVNYMICEL